MDETKVYQKIAADLNNSGSQYTVALVPYNEDNGNFSCQLVVSSGSNVVWHGPKPIGNDPSCIKAWAQAGPKIQMAADIDGDGFVELIISEPISDLRPTQFMVWRWNGISFEFKFSKALVENPRDSKRFVWTDMPYEYTQDRWVSKLSAANRTINAAIIDTHTKSQIKTIQTRLAGDVLGFHMVP